MKKKNSFLNLPLFVSPVFRYSENGAGPAGYVTNEQQVGADLFDFITQFFTIFDSYKQRPLYVAGERGVFIVSFDS